MEKALRGTIIDVLLISLFALFTAIGGSIKIPFMPYHPTTVQLIAVILSGALLGSFRGPVSQMLFIILGLIGAPLFYRLAPGFPVPAIAASPLFARTSLKAGWLLGFVAASYIAGKTIEYAKGYDFRSISAAATGALAVLYISGLAVPFLVMGVPIESGFFSWLWPFFLVDIVKITLVVFFLINLRGVLPTPTSSA